MEPNTGRSDAFKKRQRRVLILAAALLMIYSAWARYKDENPPRPPVPIDRAAQGTESAPDTDTSGARQNPAQ